MDRGFGWSLRVVDFTGGLVVLASLLGFVWLVLVRNDRVRTEIDELAQIVRRAQLERRALRAAIARQRTILAEYEDELNAAGQLPSQTPVDSYFQTLSRLVLKHGLRVVRHNPLSTRYYPGLLEQRFAYVVTGSLANLVEFLKAIEDSDYWADVGYLQLDRGQGSEATAAARRVAKLTISLFSSIPSEASSEGGGV